MNAAELPALRAKLSGPFRELYQGFVTHLDGTIDQTGDDSYHVLNYAFVYRVGEVPGIRYANSMTAYAARAKRALLEGQVSGWSAGVGYDWLFDVLTPEERAAVVAVLSRTTAPKVQTNPLDDGELLERSGYVITGLAFWGDGVDDAAAETMVDAYEPLIVDSTLALHNLVAADDGGWSQGMDYSAHGPRGNVAALTRVLEAWRTSNGLTREAVFGGQRATVLRYHPQWVAYSIFPEAVPTPGRPDGFDYRLYKTHVMPAGLPVYLHALQNAVLGGVRLFRDIDPAMASLAQWLISRRVGDVSVSGVGGTREALFAHFLFGEAVTPQSPSALRLPLTKKFDGLGWVVMRTEWDDPQATMVTFIASPWSRAVGSYTNLNQGSFTINRGGPLVINSGVAVHHGYAGNTWSSNTMIFPDPNDTTVATKKYHDLGGQRWAGNPEFSTPARLMHGSPWDIGGIRRFQAARAADGDFDYIYADLVRAYSSTAYKDVHNDSKLESYTRQFINFRKRTPEGSDFVIVFDRVKTTETRFEKRWLLHTSGDPAVNGTEIADGPGRWVYDGASRIMQENSGTGRLVVTSLLPLSRKVVKIGGAPSGESPFGVNGHAFVNPYGVQDPSTKGITPDRVPYIGTHRVEVISTSGGLDDAFLHVLEVSDARTTASAETALLSGVGLVGARFGERIAVFRRTEGATLGGEITVDRAGTYDTLVCDLEPGRQYVIGGQLTAFASGAGVIYGSVTMPAAGARLTIQATGVMATRPDVPKNLRFNQ